jgi:WD40 repeat protein
LNSMNRVVTHELGNPFPGLRPFQEDEEHLFFGRESQVDRMVDKLAATHFLAVVGTSGSGKSSLVNCGLRPALHRGLMAAAGTSWRMAQFRPGSDPLRSMARALARDGVLFSSFDAAGIRLEDMVEATLRMSKLGLSDLYDQAPLGHGPNLLLIVDQFEELFRYRALSASTEASEQGRKQEATAFVNLLLESNAQAKFPIYVVLTMRSDFLGDCAEFAGLPEAINEGQYLVPRMNRKERGAAIAGPVGVGGGEINPVLLTRLVNDVGDNPDQLSILQHALNRTWARWQHEGHGEGPLNLSHYEAIGTMAHALDQHAEKAYTELGSEPQRRICEKIFKALTDKATDTRGTRRPTKLATLCALADASQAEVVQVIDVFRKPSRSFLMPPPPEPLDRETVIDISHESLMRVWERLKTWADDEAQWAQLYRRLSETATLHAVGKAGLYAGPDLVLSLKWREEQNPTEAWAGLHRGALSQAMSFLAESEAQRDKDLQDKEEHQRRELEQAQALASEQRHRAEEQTRAASRLRWWAAAFGVVALVAVGAVLYGWLQRVRANQQAELNISDGLTKDANSSLEADPELSVLLAMGAIQSIEGMAPKEALDALVSATGKAQFLHAKLTLVGHKGGVVGVAFSPDAKHLATLGQDGTVKIWDAVSGKELLTTPSMQGQLHGLAFSPDGSRLVTARDRTAVVWEAASLKELMSLSGHSDGVTSVVFSPDGKHLATASFDTKAKIWDAASGKQIRTLSGHDRGLTAVTFSPDGKRLATASDDGSAIVWETASGKQLLRLAGHTGGVTALTFSPGGERLATASEDGTVKVWNTATGKQLLAWGSDAAVTCVAFSPDGGRLATASGYKTQLWDAATGTFQVTLLGHKAGVRSITFSPDGARLATASEDKSVKVLDTPDPESIRPNDPREQARQQFERRLEQERERERQSWEIKQNQAVTRGLIARLRSLVGLRPAVTAQYKAREYQLIATAREGITRTLNTEECRHYLQAPVCPPWVEATGLVIDGQNLARSTNIKGAIASFRKAKELDGTVQLNPDLEATKLAEKSLLSQAENLARSGALDAAVASFKQAKELDSKLKLDPETEAKKYASRGLQVKARNLASVGDTTGAVAAFRDAIALDPKLKIDPEVEAERPKAESLLAKATRLSQQDRFKQAVPAYTQAIAAFGRLPRLDPDGSIRAEAWNDLCWEASLRRQAAEVMDACEHAVKEAQHLQPGSWNSRDSRGVARALTGNMQGAIEDFQFYVNHAQDKQLKEQRQQWIDDLGKGKKPDEVLKSLLVQ